MILLNNFLNRFPEFADTEKKLVQMALAESTNEISSSFFGDLWETAVIYLAAHKLSLSPMGEPARLEGMEHKTIYQLELERLCKSTFLGARTI